MTINETTHIFSTLPQVKALLKLLEDGKSKNIFLQGLTASATPMLFAALAYKQAHSFLFVMNDNDEAGYFYNDLKTMLAPEDDAEPLADVLFFPSSYRRAIKYGQCDAGNEILRTEVLTKLAAIRTNLEKGKTLTPLFIVSEPSAIAELVVSQRQLDERRLTLTVDQHINVVEVGKKLREYGFSETDYVYEPGQFAIRGSIIDVYSFSSEMPYRIDFFGDDIDTIRTFEVETQLSVDKKKSVDIVPELATLTEEKVSFLQFLPQDTTLVFKDFLFVRDAIDQIYKEGFTQQVLTEQLEGKTEVEQCEIRQRYMRESQLIATGAFMTDALNFPRIEFGASRTTEAMISADKRQRSTIVFHTTPQPLFHKNFDLLITSLKDYLLKGYKLYIFADSEKQTVRLKDIFDSKAEEEAELTVSANNENLSVASHIMFTPVNHTLHEGFVDENKKVCFFTDHQIFDRFHRLYLWKRSNI